LIKETSGVVRFQAIQTAPARLEIRLEVKQAADDASTWERVYASTGAFFTSQGLENVTIQLAPEAPMCDPKSGKFPNVWASLPGK
jgi:hypothetical protein